MELALRILHLLRHCVVCLCVRAGVSVCVYVHTCKCDCCVGEWMRVGVSVYVVCFRGFCSEDTSDYCEEKLCWLKLLLVYTTYV